MLGAGGFGEALHQNRPLNPTPDLEINDVHLSCVFYVLYHGLNAGELEDLSDGYLLMFTESSSKAFEEGEGRRQYCRMGFLVAGFIKWWLYSSIKIQVVEGWRIDKDKYLVVVFFFFTVSLVLSSILRVKTRSPHSASQIAGRQLRSW
nr:hypothetical protein Iba_scaffold922857CG0010 [Ipomoea batatas]